MAIKRKKEKAFGPVFVMFIILAVIAVLSLIFSLFEIEAYKTVIANNTLETVLVTVKNVFSIEGFQFLVGNIVNNFRQFEPLIYMIISLLGIGICERSGLLYAIFSPLKKVKFNIIIFLTLFISIISTILLDYSYIFLIPLIGLIYKYLEKNPALGILISFIGITVGYGTGIMFNYNDYLLGNLTQAAASLDVDKNYKYSLFSNIYIMIASTLLISYLGTIIVNKFLVHKLPRKYVYEEEELIISNKAKKITLFSFLGMIMIIIYFILPINLPGAGILLDQNASRYIEKLFSDNSPFGNGLVFIVSALFILCGYIYGKISKNIKSSHEFSLGLSKNFENLGFLFVLMFFISQVLAVIEWSNLGVVIGAKLIEFMGTLKFSGMPLIITFIVVVIIIGILMPNTLSKWELMSPTIVPLFMQSNITPGFTQFIFKVADGIGKCISPIFMYYIIMLAFLEKYRVSERKQVSLFGVYKLILPSILLISLVWIFIICLWYLIGFPIGIGIYPTI